MPSYCLPITGLRHHDFKGRLDELYELAPGRRMSISIEHDNPSETDAVIAYMGKDFVGYVRSGTHREQACALIQASGRDTLLGKVTSADREKRWLWLEINMEQPTTLPKPESRPTPLTNWSFDGELLPIDEEELRLRSMLSCLEDTLATRDPWDDDMEQWLQYVEQNLWRDISQETSLRTSRILTLLTEADRPDYYPQANRLQMTIDRMGSPEWRLRQANQIIEQAQSKQMTSLLLHYGDKARESIQKLPEPLLTLFLDDGERFMGRLWYLHCPHQQIRALKTLLAMMVRLHAQDAESAPTDSIPMPWALSWAKRQQDKSKAEVVRELLSTFELERTSPQFAQQIQQMMDSCNTAVREANVLKEVAALPRINNTFAQGSVSVNAGATLMGNIQKTINHPTE